jgi:radical SAM protein with 4Fe4S-binding SPASM domain
MITPKKKFILFKQSKNFCSVPWNYLKVDMTGNVSTCNWGKNKLGKLTESTIEEILQNTDLQDIRSTLVTDSPHDNCQTCKKYETGEEYKYFRGLYNPMFQSVDVDYNNPQAFVLSGIDLHWSSTCNLKCITCWSGQSSSIAQEENKPIRNTPTEHADKLIDFIVDNQHSLKEIYLSGGEPTLIKHNLRLLKRLRKDLNFEIRINTNMMFDLQNPVITELKKFPNVLFTISADATGDRFNYIRRGADWNLFINNLTELHKMHFRWRVNSVFFVATALRLPQTQEFFIDNFGIRDFTINQESMGHDDIRSRHLSPANKITCIENIKQHQAKYSSNTNLYGQLENCLKELNLPGEPNYSEYFDAVDKKAGTNWRQIFKEIA